jgi:hypothetical protein
MATDHDAVSTIAGEIARYLARYPDASDSLDGIRRWWLARLRYEEAADLVQQALVRLEAEGTVTKRVLPGGATVYEAAEPRT